MKIRIDMGIKTSNSVISTATMSASTIGTSAVTSVMGIMVSMSMGSTGGCKPL